MANDYTGVFRTTMKSVFIKLYKYDSNSNCNIPTYNLLGKMNAVMSSS